MTLSRILASGELLDAVERFKQFSPFPCLLAIVVICFTCRNLKREARLIKRIETLEDEVHNVLLPLVNDRTGLISRDQAQVGKLTT
jgi:hypothetical protein